MIRIKGGDIIKHERFMDVAFYVTKVYGPFGSENTLKVKGIWMNQGFTKSWVINPNPETIKIKLADLDKWLVCLDANADPCLRKCQWKVCA